MYAAVMYFCRRPIVLLLTWPASSSRPVVSCGALVPSGFHRTSGVKIAFCRKFRAMAGSNSFPICYPITRGWSFLPASAPSFGYTCSSDYRIIPYLYGSCSLSRYTCLAAWLGVIHSWTFPEFRAVFQPGLLLEAADSIYKRKHMKNLTIICHDCRKRFTYAYMGQGFMPDRCPDCTKLWNSLRHILGYRRKHGLPEPGQVGQKKCSTCGGAFEYVHSGNSPPRTCKNCKRKKESHKKRLRKAGYLSDSQWAEICTIFGNCCAYCQRKVECLEVDHFVPVKLGGVKSPSNVVPACRSCNARKHSKHPSAWLDREKYDEICKVLSNL